MDTKLEFLEERIRLTDIIDSPEITYIRLLFVITSLFLDDIKYSIDQDSFDFYTKKLKSLKEELEEKYIDLPK